VVDAGSEAPFTLEVHVLDFSLRARAASLKAMTAQNDFFQHAAPRPFRHKGK
jgi:hypothetical protein